MNWEADFLRLVNQVRAHKGLSRLERISAEARLREDLGFDSLDLAELTARIDAEFGVDVFAEGIVGTVGEIAARVRAAKAVKR